MTDFAELPGIDPSQLVQHFSDAAELVVRAYFNTDENEGFRLQEQIHRELKAIKEQAPSLGALNREHDNLLRATEDWPDDVSGERVESGLQAPGFNRGVAATILALGRAMGISAPALDVTPAEPSQQS